MNKCFQFTFIMLASGWMGLPEGSAATYQVGPGRTFKTLQAVAGVLGPGDVVQVDGDATYTSTNRLQFLNNGTEGAPITIVGVRSNGMRPVLSAINQVLSNSALVEFRADYYVFEGFEVDGAGNTNLLRGLYNAGDHTVIRDTLVRDCPSHGILGSDSSGSLTLDKVEVRDCGGGTQYHQIYVASDNLNHSNAVFRMQFCYVHQGNGGNNVKSRVGRSEIYYNWIEGALYHELDLIGADLAAQATNTADLVREDADVVGNVLYKQDGTLGDAARLGSDGTGSSNGRYRFVNNTIVLAGSFANYVFKIRGPRQSVEIHNNVVYRVGGSPVRLVESTEPALGAGDGISGSNNWLPTGSTFLPSGLQGTIRGTDPRIASVSTFDFAPTNASPLLDTGRLPTQSPTNYPFPSPLAEPLFLPPIHSPPDPVAVVERESNPPIDIGAFEAPPMPPVITSHPTNLLRLQGQTATFRVSAAGSQTNSSPLCYQWSFNGSPIGDATNATYTIAAVRTNDAGNYAATVTNAYGSASSSNAVLDVSPDTSDPTVTIAYPTNQSRFTDNRVTLRGQATDNSRVSQVLVSLNGTSSWQAASLTAASATLAYWTNTITLEAGSNQVHVKSVDFAGNESAVLSRSCFLSVPAPLTVVTHGSGLLKGKASGYPIVYAPLPPTWPGLNIGQAYTVSACPNANNLFSNIVVDTTNIIRNPKNYTFVMHSNMTMELNFVTNAFVVAKGQYSGLFYETLNGVQVASAGAVQVTLASASTSLGTFSGLLYLGGAKVTFAGTFDMDGAAHVTTLGGPIPGIRPTDLYLQLDRDGAVYGTNLTITGVVSNSTAGWSSDLQADKRYFKGTGPLCPLAGMKYTMVMPGTNNVPGDGYATIAMAGGGGGGVSVSGKYADAASISISPLLGQPIIAPLSRELRYPFYTRLYSMQNGTPPTFFGLGLGWLSFTTNSLGGWISWVKPATAGALYPNHGPGLTNDLIVLGSRYVPPASGGPVVAPGTYRLSLTDGLITPINITGITYGLVAPAKFVVPANSIALKLSFAASTGQFGNDGVVLFSNFKYPPLATPATRINGVVLQDTGVARGFFIGSGQTTSGLVLFEPTP